MKKRTPRKYEHHQSQFYRLRCRRGLATLLNVPSERVLRELVRMKPLTYRVFPNETGRIIEVQTGRLLKVHERAAGLLRRLQLPHYVHSQKRRSYVSNASIHATNEPTIKTDISGYFAHTTAAAICRFFRNVMQCSPDVAWLIGELLCYDGHVATGSPVSNELAYFANQHILDAINAHVEQRGCRMSLLVDDITVSGAAASTTMLYEIKAMLRTANHQVSRKPNKTRTYGVGQTKHITGTIVRDGKVKLPNRRQKDLRDAYVKVTAQTTKAGRISAMRKLRGHLAEAKNVDAAGISAKFSQSPRHHRQPVARQPVTRQPVTLKKAA